MTNPSEEFPPTGLVEVFTQTIEQRQFQLTYLLGEFARAVELSNDLGRINEVIGASDRPDLVMTQANAY
jgi:hypothetical protein